MYSINMPGARLALICASLHPVVAHETASRPDRYYIAMAGSGTRPVARSAPRARRVLMFLVIVWSIGGCFLAFEAGIRTITEFAISRRPPETRLAGQSAEAAAHCREVLRSLPPASRENP